MGFVIVHWANIQIILPIHVEIAQKDALTVGLPIFASVAHRIIHNRAPNASSKMVWGGR